VSFRILRDWAAQHRYGNVTTAQFITLAKRDSGRNLQYLFDVWLYQPTSQRPGRAFGCSEPAITDVQPAASTSPGLAARQRMTRTRRSTLGTDTALWSTGTSAQKSRRPLKWVTTSGRVSWYNAIRWPPGVRNEQHGP
jgi:hypothetical protein